MPVITFEVDEKSAIKKAIKDANSRRDRLKIFTIGQNSVIDWLYTMLEHKPNYRLVMDGLSEEFLSQLKVEHVFADPSYRGISLVLSHPDWGVVANGSEIPRWDGGLRLSWRGVKEPPCEPSLEAAAFAAAAGAMACQR